MIAPTDTIGDDVKLYRGDCLAVLPTLATVDALVTDPPYGIDLQNNDVDGHRRIGEFGIVNDHDQKAGMQVLDWSFDAEIPYVFFASPWKPWPGKWRNLIVWDKGGAVGGGGDIQRCLKRSWELIQVARNGPMNGERDESVWRFPIIPSDTVDHIAAKPVSLMRRLVQRFTNPGDTILDPFMGSGSTGLACIQTGRKFIGIELDPTHYATALKRLNHATGAGPGQLFEGFV